ncbi:MAG TPA: aminofutalosine synthase MqnE [Kofleriaceae bacterium]|nr:aminofutalosine synthase MqnE [Kofleriaceae bacterium]
MDTLSEIGAKLDGGERLGFDDGVRLMRERNLPALGALANRVRERLHGDRTYFNVNMHLNATNVCVADCKFCSFARLEEGMPGAYTMTVAEAVAKLASAPADLTEIHIVNGLHPGLPFSYYEELLSGLKALRPSVHLKAFTAVEIAFFAEHYGLTVETVLERLVKAGLGSLPGGGAEVFADRVRQKICRDKVDARGWIAVHHTAHRMGLRSNCTLLYGHIETVEERVDHLLRLRDAQDVSGGFQTFIPLAFHNENNALERLPGPTGCEDLRLFSVARLLLDNIPHVKAYWAMLGVKTAQTALWFGADDLDGTVEEEKIYKMAGSRTPEALTRDELVRLIRAAGRTPVERDTLYRVVAEGDALDPAPRRRGRLEVVA